ncbi:6-phosphogluconolactonase [Natronoglycomyces albus]|uniref:6-phosphogluconolactonase n=1 Tax=Natronoglycomyces albus TaxID=2811108 RepID=A0A895XKA6_9ACTN|nr:6-phosphogluconolactonase [Natronoglycomyces albus]QSB03869.1 6-phosphogluconolactonase [Natronoglycomyces albus]
MSAPSLVIHPTQQVLVHGVAGRLINALADAQARRGEASVVLTGGRVAAQVYAAVAASPARDAVDWARVHFWWGDERFVPAGDEDRNEIGARAALLNALPVDQRNVHPIPGQGAFADPQEAAAHYESELKRVGEGDWPTFDVLLLGVGEDAHVASLFPHHEALRVVEPAVLGVHGSPKPPPMRVTLSLGAINSAREVWLVASGPGKADAVALAYGSVMGSRQASVEEAPASGVRGTEATRWLLDAAASARLSSE